jgi:hypothetical protein
LCDLLALPVDDLAGAVCDLVNHLAFEGTAFHG